MATYPSMNEKIVGFLRGTDPMKNYAADRIEELEARCRKMEGALKLFLRYFKNDDTSVWVYDYMSERGIVAPDGVSYAVAIIDYALDLSTKDPGGDCA
jgi:hypothetical protein